jgi:hypothetical protein
MARVGQRTGDRIVGVVPGKTEGRQRAPGPGGVAVRFRVHRSPGPECSMDIASFSPALVSAGTVALAEIGDKTQLLALVLAARFRKPLPIVVGILVATLLNHALAGWLGTLVAHWLTPQVLRWVVAGSFLAIALWSLKPDTLDEDTPVSAHGALMATVLLAAN